MSRKTKFKLKKLLYLIAVMVSAAGYVIAIKYAKTAPVVLKILIVGCVIVMIGDLFGKMARKPGAECFGTQFDGLKTQDFGTIIKNYFSLYGCQLDERQADEGYPFDILLKKGKETMVIQLSYFENGSKVGKFRLAEVDEKEIMRIISIMKHYSAQRALVISNSTFSEEAVDFAGRYDITLWDREKMNSILSKVYVDMKDYSVEVLTK